jgi:capsular polysaccharide biosynthesis protein
MTKTLLVSAERCPRRRPENLLGADNGLFDREYVKDFDAVSASMFSHVQILANGFLVGSGSPLPQSFTIPPSGFRKLKIAARTLQHRVLSSCTTRVKQGLFVTDEFSNGFFHWICDVLPRIEALSAAEPQELAGRTLIVPAMADCPYLLPSLQPFPIGAPHILKWRERAACDDLLIVPSIAPTGNYRPSLMRALRERFRDHFGVPAGSRRIYVSREGAARRRIANEKEILPVLERHGFERVIVEKLSFAEQVRLLGSACMLVGNHGAGLTNMLWMSSGSRVLELRRRGDGENNCYFALASALDLPYYYMQCDASNAREATHLADLLVDPKVLESALASLTGR